MKVRTLGAGLMLQSESTVMFTCTHTVFSMSKENTQEAEADVISIDFQLGETKIRLHCPFHAQRAVRVQIDLVLRHRQLANLRFRGC